MRIILSATGNTSESNLDTRFGRCEFFLLYDTESKEFETLVNSGMEAQGGAGIKAAGQIIESKADVVITGNLGPNAFELIERAGVKAYSCEVMPIKKALEQYQNQELREISAAGRAHHGNHGR